MSGRHLDPTLHQPARLRRIVDSGALERERLRLLRVIGELEGHRAARLVTGDELAAGLDTRSAHHLALLDVRVVSGQVVDDLAEAFSGLHAPTLAPAGAPRETHIRRMHVEEAGRRNRAKSMRRAG